MSNKNCIYRFCFVFFFFWLPNVSPACEGILKAVAGLGRTGVYAFMLEPLVSPCHDLVLQHLWELASSTAGLDARQALPGVEKNPPVIIYLDSYKG